MHLERLTRLAERRAHERVASGFIIETIPGRLRDVIEEIAPVTQVVEELFPRILTREVPVLGMRPLKAFRQFNMIATILPREIVFRLAENRFVKRIFSDEPCWAFQYPTVPPEGVFKAPHKITEEITFTSTWHTRKLIGADRANAQGFWGRDVLVSVADTGGSKVHRQTRRMNFETAMKGLYTDGNGHGEWCLSCVGGIESDDEYLSRASGRRVRCLGMAPECDLLSVKCLGYVIGTGMTSQIINAMSISFDRNADIISMSLGGESQATTPEEDPFYPVFDKCLENNVIPVVAAGNSGPAERTIGSPGCLPQPLTIGAYDPITGEIADFSSRGPTDWGDIKPDCVFPGVNIDSGIVGMLDSAGDGVPSRFSPISGTSMATPHGAGLIAPMRESMRERVGKILTVDEIKRMLAALGHPKNNTDGWGVLDWEMFETYLETEYSVKL